MFDVPESFAAALDHEAIRRLVDVAPLRLRNDAHPFESAAGVTGGRGEHAVGARILPGVGHRALHPAPEAAAEEDERGGRDPEHALKLRESSSLRRPMTTTFVKGDLFEDTKGPDLHGIAFVAECSGDTSKGVASACAKRWPAFGEALREHAGAKGMEVGDVFAWREGDVVVYALAVLRGEQKPKLAAFTRAVEQMLAQAQRDGVNRIGLARAVGLDVDRVKRVLTDAGASSPVSLVVFEQFVRAKVD